jgi:uncharacterized protein YdhG (YjbR/CyaY superfamily)
MSRMKKAKSGKRASGTKTKSSTAPKTVDEYLARVPEPAHGTLLKIRATIRSAVPAEATETLSYGIPAFKYKGTLVWYAAFAKHCSLFPTAAVIKKFDSDLKGYTISKGTIQFPIDKPLPAALVNKIVKARVTEVQSKKSR